MKYYFCKLLPPRPSFTMDMTEAELAIMREHVAYWKTLLDRGVAIVFGPVADPNGSFGLGVMKLEDTDDITELTSRDPAMLSNHGFSYEVHPMLRAIYRE